MVFRRFPRWRCLTLVVLSFTIPRMIDSSDEASGEGLDSSGDANSSNETGYEDCGDPSICGSGATQGNLPLAFGLTIAAGLSTTLGALMPCIPLVKRSNKLFLSAALATAGGVMLYVSFTEIFVKAQDYLCCATSQHYYLLATINLFLGVALTILLEMLLKLLRRIQCKSTKRHLKKVGGRLKMYSGTSHQRSNGKHAPDHYLRTANPLGPLGTVGENQNSGEKDKSSKSATVDNSTERLQVCISDESASSSLPCEQNDIGPTTSDAILMCNGSATEDNKHLAVRISSGRDREQERDNGSMLVSVQVDQGVPRETEEDTTEIEEVVATLGGTNSRLQQMGLLTALALALHNFPEGLATFIAALSDPSLGITLAIAIALHNIPEGMCVSMPVYYATGSRIKAFIWAFLSGVSEPIGALVGWLILNDLLDSHGSIVYGVAFGLIAGLMIYLSLKELIPMSYRFDSTGGTIVTIFLLVGMIIMAISLVLFEYT